MRTIERRHSYEARKKIQIIDEAEKKGEAYVKRTYKISRSLLWKGSNPLQTRGRNTSSLKNEEESTSL